MLPTLQPQGHWMYGSIRVYGGCEGYNEVANLSHENGFELQHASDGEQNCWVIRYQGTAGQPDMLMLFIELQETLSDFSTSQLWRGSNLAVNCTFAWLCICRSEVVLSRKFKHMLNRSSCPKA